jgi:GTP-binding protein YchF
MSLPVAGMSAQSTTADGIIDAMKIGLIGLPKSGKTSLFNLLTGAGVATSRYDGGRAELHTGIARVPDERVDRLSALFHPKKTTYATFDVVDLAGITKGERAGLEARDFRNADALLHVVRAFPDDALGAANPRRDIEDLETELLLADLEVIERRLDRLEASIKKRRTDADVKEQALLQRVKPALEAETPLRAMALTPDDERALRGFTFLSLKPILHCLNIDEKSVGEGERSVEVFGLGAIAARPHTRVGWVSAVIETEVAQLAGDEQQAFLADLGLAEPAIRRVLRDCYALLGLISFFTVGEDEVRAWPIPAGTRAQDAAGTVHSDIARGFIRAEVTAYDELVAVGGSFAEIRARGQLRLEGKDYVVKDGEVCHFRFNVGK